MNEPEVHKLANECLTFGLNLAFDKKTIHFVSKAEVLNSK